jgi:hypothetical protein
MPLVRAWTRGLSGASGAALLVPGGIIAALLLLALAGSFGRLGGLGQAFTGPAAFSPGPAASAVHAPPGGAPALLGVVAAPAAVVAPAAVAGRSTRAGSGVAIRPPATPPGKAPSGAAGGAPTAPPSPGTPTGPGACGSCTPPPPPTHQTLVDQVVNLGTSVTSKLPGPVGQLTTQLLKQAGATVDRVLPTDRLPTPARTVGQVGATLSQLKLP